MHMSNSKGLPVPMHNLFNRNSTQPLPKNNGTRGGREIQARARVAKNNEVEKVVYGKRGGEDHPKLPSKHRLVSKDYGSSSFSMVEAMCQPRQSQ